MDGVEEAGVLSEEASADLMSTDLFVSPATTAGCLQFELWIRPRNTVKGKTFCLTHPSSISSSEFCNNLVNAINRHYSSDRSSVAGTFRALSAHLVASNGFAVDASRSLGEVLVSTPQCTIFSIDVQVDTDHKTLHFPVQQDPARIRRCRLEIRPMVGCPMIPLLDVDNLCLTKSRFEWFVEKNGIWPSEPSSLGFVFTPKLEHVGSRLRLRVQPVNSKGNPGVPFARGSSTHAVEGKLPVIMSPAQKFHFKRFVETSSFLEPNCFRVVCYNLLAEMYSRTELAKTLIFRHCPVEFLTWLYRLPLILRELSSYRADFLVLQEVDRQHYDGYLVPFFRSLGMSGLFTSKRGMREPSDASPHMTIDLAAEKGEGCAIFYREAAFELVRVASLPSLLAYAHEEAELAELIKRAVSDWKPAECPDYGDGFHLETEREKAHSHCLTVGVFRAKATGGGSSLATPRYVIVASTHFYFHPNGTFFRIIQAGATRHYLYNLASKISAELKAPISVLLGGDLNQAPGSLVQEMLKHGTAYGSSVQSSQPHLHSAYAENPPEFTNWVPDFKAALDVILYTSTYGLKVVRTLPLLSCEEIQQLCASEQSGVVPISTDNSTDSTTQRKVAEEDRYALPNAQFPSDHLALIAEFAWE